jgi:hypothetical protein
MVALICIVEVRCAAGFSPSGALVISCLPVALGGSSDLRTEMATDSVYLAVTMSPILIWSKFLADSGTLMVTVFPLCPFNVTSRLSLSTFSTVALMVWVSSDLRPGD